MGAQGLPEVRIAGSKRMHWEAKKEPHKYNCCEKLNALKLSEIFRTSKSTSLDQQTPTIYPASFPRNPCMGNGAVKVRLLDYVQVE